MSKIIKELGIPKFPHCVSTYLCRWERGNTSQADTLKFLFGGMVGEVLPVFTKWGGRIAHVYLTAAHEGLPVRIFIDPSRFAGDKPRFSIQCIPRSRPDDPCAWVAQFTFYESQMTLHAHDVDSAKPNTEWVEYDLSLDAFRIWCTASIRCMYQTCGKYLTV